MMLKLNNRMVSQQEAAKELLTKSTRVLDYYTNRLLWLVVLQP